MPSPSVGGVRELRVALTVDDFERAATLYRDGLGLPVVQEWESPQGRGLVLALERATLELVDEAQADHIDRVEVGRRIHSPVRLAFEVPDVEATASHLQQRGANALGGPVPTPWGHLNQRLQTVDGVQLTLFQRTQR